jgi:type VI secretion system protein
MARYLSGPSLYEKLMGTFADGSDIEDSNEKTQVLLSVMDNIRVILNSRQGSLKHLPDYGMPDLTMVYRHLPASAHLLKKHISQTLLCYEPRLKAVDVELREPSQDELLCYELVCELKQSGLVRFGTYFTPEGPVNIKRIV